MSGTTSDAAALSYIGRGQYELAHRHEWAWSETANPQGDYPPAIVSRGARMTIFGREFPTERLCGAVLEENAWLCDMLRYWRPSGCAIGSYAGEEHATRAVGELPEEGPEHLRLAIRNGYLSFYRGG